MILLFQGCNKPSDDMSAQNKGQSNSNAVLPDNQDDESDSDLSNQTTVKKSTNVTPEVIVNPDDEGWLYVVSVDKDEEGGWATGTYDRPKNKIIIQERNVTSFALRLHQMNIDWSDSVILRINGKNRQLVKRDDPIVIFERSSTGSWKVKESKKE